MNNVDNTYVEIYTENQEWQNVHFDFYFIIFFFNFLTRTSFLLMMLSFHSKCSHNIKMVCPKKFMNILSWRVFIIRGSAMILVKLALGRIFNSVFTFLVLISTNLLFIFILWWNHWSVLIQWKEISVFYFEESILFLLELSNKSNNEDMLH